MKTITRLLGLASIVAMFVFLDACKGEKGDVGPIGTTGVAGPTGANGAVGAVGATGATGTANVIYGNWVDMNVVGYWYKLSGATAAQNNSSYQSNNGWGSNFAAPITQDLLDKALILIYGKYQNGFTDKNVYLLPSSVLTGYSVEAFAGLNRIYIQTIYPSTNIVSSASVYSPTAFINQFRYIIVPGSINGRKAAVDYTDYEAVKKFYNLKD